MAQRDQRPQQVLAAVRHQVIVRVHPQRVVEAVDQAGRLQRKPIAEASGHVLTGPAARCDLRLVGRTGHRPLYKLQALQATRRAPLRNQQVMSAGFYSVVSAWQVSLAAARASFGALHKIKSCCFRWGHHR